MNYILIIMLIGQWSESGHAINSINLKSSAACNLAREQVLQVPAARGLEIKALCVPEKV